MNGYFKKNPNIVFGKQFYDNGYLEIKDSKYKSIDKPNSFKANKMISYLNELSKNYDVVNTFFADDSSMEHEILNYMILKHEELISNKNIKSLFINRKGITELNNHLYKYLHQDEKRMK